MKKFTKITRTFRRYPKNSKIYQKFIKIPQDLEDSLRVTEGGKNQIDIFKDFQDPAVSLQ